MTMPDRSTIQEAEAEALRGSLQSRSEDQPFGDVPIGYASTGGLYDAGLLFQLGTIADNIPRWSIYPGQRDRLLREYYKTEPICAGAVYSISARVKSLAWNLTGQGDLHTGIEAMFAASDLGGGLRQLLMKTVIDLSTQDNGAFWEIIGAGRADSQMIGAPTAVNYLDPAQCWRTFDPQFPVLYINPITGKHHRLHRSRVMMMSSMTQPNELARGIGLCPLSRALLAVQHMKSILQYRYEKASGKFERGIIYGSGLTIKTLQKLMTGADVLDDSEGLTRIGRMPAYVTPTGVELGVLDLASIPDNFVLKDETEVYVYTLALAFGVDAREFWTATQSGATKADASIQNMKARGKGLADILTTVKDNINKLMPDGVTFDFDFVDEDADRRKAETDKVIVDTLSTIKSNGGLSNEQYQAMLIEAGVLDPIILAQSASIAEIDDMESPNGDAAPRDGDSVDNELETEQRTKNGYRRRLREAVRGLYQRDLNFAQYVSSMDSSIRRGFRQAFTAGLGEAGISFDEMNGAERRTLQQFIIDEMGYVMRLGRDIIAAREDDTKTLKQLFKRLDMWVNRYDRVQSKARLMGNADQKLRWVLNPAKENCDDCIKLNGRVYRASVWDKYNIEPKSPLLECFGGYCGCEFESVGSDVPAMPGRPPRISGQKSRILTKGKIRSWVHKYPLPDVVATVKDDRQASLDLLDIIQEGVTNGV